MSLSDEQIEQAEQRGRAVLENGPLALSVRYEGKSGRVIVDFSNGCIFAFPHTLAQGLEAASESDLAEVKVLGIGYGLHWETLDVNLSVSDLMAGLFGTRKHMARVASEAASSST